MRKAERVGLASARIARVSVATLLMGSLAIALAGCGGASGMDSAGTSGTSSTSPTTAADTGSGSTSGTASSTTGGSGTSGGSGSTTGGTTSGGTSGGSGSTGGTTGGGTTAPPVTTSSVTLAWQPPTENTNGTPITDLAGYKIHYGTASANYTQVVSVENSGLTRYVLENLAKGTYYFAITAFNSKGLESALSGEVTATLN